MVTVCCFECMHDTFNLYRVDLNLLLQCLQQGLNCQ
jgi:hypothetical protein